MKKVLPIVLIVVFTAGIPAQDTPDSLLQVVENERNDSLRFDALYALNGFWNANGNDIYYNNGNVGIGTTSPTGRLHVDGGTALAGDVGSNITLRAQQGGAGQS